MNKIWKKYVLISLLMTTNGFAGNPDTTKTPSLKLKNCRVKGLMKDLIKDGAIRDNDVVLISFIEENNEQYLYFGFSSKGRLFLLTSSYELCTHKFIGYSKIFNRDCFVFGDKAEFFFTKKDSVQIPDYFDWLLLLNQMKEEDFLPPYFRVDSDGNLVEVDMHVNVKGALYKCINKRFVFIPWDKAPRILW